MAEIIVVSIMKGEYDFTPYYKYISKERIIKINNYHFKEDAKRSLIGALLVRYMVCEKLQVRNESLDFTTGQNGKPYLIAYENCYFNLSHSENKVVCIIDQEQNGIDIEKMQECNLDIVRRYFHIKEYMDIGQIEKENKDKYFTFLWTMKEAYVKFLGVGLTKELSSFYIQKTIKNQIKIIDELYGKKNIYETLTTEDNYVISYSAPSKAQITNITDQTLLKLVRESILFR